MRRKTLLAALSLFTVWILLWGFGYPPIRSDKSIQVSQQPAISDHFSSQPKELPLQQHQPPPSRHSPPEGNLTSDESQQEDNVKSKPLPQIHTQDEEEETSKTGYLEWASQQCNFDFTRTITKPKQKGFDFLHFPKTGTSFTTTLRNYLDVCKVKDFTCILPRGEGGKESPGCIASLIACDGHAPLQPWRWAKKSNDSKRIEVNHPPVVTLFRHPAHRLYSAFHDNRHALGFIGDTNLLKSAANVIEFARISGIEGCQLKMMLGHACAIHYPIRGSDLETAKKRVMDTLSFVGITDFYHSSVCLFHAMFGGIPRPAEFKNSRPGKYIQPLTNQTEIKLLEEIDHWDMKLYEFALSHFHKKMKAVGMPLIETNQKIKT